ncbi:hypothetical protein GUITHDRAFT_119982 [Guillardia theta CCMP2712]|uniref:Uncharacterized protein n=2 Tax=Guillardia theta TaxID=55529 RepID=L1IC51_GUITC|nr:hypothetical protein GUITHDRAFT_119982 [Guillardia theta CCMP2712]EKX33811.1 hypothetical protein GUITHDRAFT_119982 [Guillardia theta CCMP2712]|eukprot:XP_005820791.1 hypothetical protein GUITHDRAFT_119982 [Guillardia theta CCMP2712]
MSQSLILLALFVLVLVASCVLADVASVPAMKPRSCALNFVATPAKFSLPLRTTTVRMAKESESGIAPRNDEKDKKSENSKIVSRNIQSVIKKVQASPSVLMGKKMKK